MEPPPSFLSPHTTVVAHLNNNEIQIQRIGHSTEYKAMYKVEGGTLLAPKPARPWSKASPCGHWRRTEHQCTRATACQDYHKFHLVSAESSLRPAGRQVSSSRRATPDLPSTQCIAALPKAWLQWARTAQAKCKWANGFGTRRCRGAHHLVLLFRSWEPPKRPRSLSP